MEVLRAVNDGTGSPFLLNNCVRIAHLRQEGHSSKSVIFQEKLLKILKCSNFL